AVCLALTAKDVVAQQVRAVLRPPAQVGPAKPEDGSAAPDGYAPIPEWLGQTRAPRPPKSAAYDVETVAVGFNGAFCFDFLPAGGVPRGRSSRPTTGASRFSKCCWTQKAPAAV